MIIVEIAGNLGADPEERFTPSGNRVVSLRVAARTRQGKEENTVWWKVSIWGDRFDRMLPYLKKGSAVIVMGEMLKPETYVDKNGQTQISMAMNADILKFSPFGRNDREGTSPQAAAPNVAPVAKEPSMSAPQQDDNPFAGDDLPF